MRLLRPATTLALFGASAGALAFLRYTRSFTTTESRTEEFESELRLQIAAVAKANKEANNNITVELDRIKNLENVKAGTEQYNELKHEILNSVSVKDFITEHKTELISELVLQRVRDEFDSIKRNLIDYRRSLRSQYVTTLVLGSLLGLAPIGISLYLLNQGLNGNYLDHDGKVLWANLIGFYVPWITIIVVIEFLATFFLKLYRNTIEMDRHLRNEITTMGMKISGFELAVMQQDTDVIKVASNYLIEADRHQILGKGQTTVELEKARYDQEAFKESASFFKGLIPAPPSGKKKRRENLFRSGR